MMIRNMFFAFLQREGALEAFLTNFRNDDRFDSIDDLFHPDRTVDLPVGAFNWVRSPEGYAFWYGLLMEWLRFIHRANDRQPVKGFRVVEGICFVSPASLDYLDEEPIN